ncbi:MAG: hypothetical protein WCD18_21420 [Thermosynechococcaceae cyanobacterium]
MPRSRAYGCNRLWSGDLQHLSNKLWPGYLHLRNLCYKLRNLQYELWPKYLQHLQYLQYKLRSRYLQHLWLYLRVAVLI